MAMLSWKGNGTDFLANLDGGCRNFLGWCREWRCV